MVPIRDFNVKVIIGAGRLLQYFVPFELYLYILYTLCQASMPLP